MIRPPFAARVALGLVVVVVDEARRLPSTAVSLPMTAVSQVLQNAMRFQQTITELAIKGDEVIALLSSSEENPSWATFDDDPAPVGSSDATLRPVPGPRPVSSRFDSVEPAAPDTPNSDTPNSGTPNSGTPNAAAPNSPAAPATRAKRTTARKKPATTTTPTTKHADNTGQDATTEGTAGRFALYSSAPEATPVTSVRPRPAAAEVPEIAEYLDYDSLTLAQLRARLRTLSVDELTTLLEYEESSGARAPFLTMLSNRISTARAT